MAKIPNPTLVSPRFNDVMLPQGAFGDPTRAMAQLAGAAKNVAGTIIKMGFEAQELRNKTQTREKFQELRQMHLEFQQEVLENNVDPAQWVGMWEKKLKGFEDSVTNAKDMPQAVRDAIGEKFGDFAMESSFKIAGDSLKENRQRAAKVFSYDVNEAAKEKRWDVALAEIDQAEKDGVIDPAEAEVARKSINYTKQISEREEVLESDPWQYFQELNDPANPHNVSEAKKKEELAKAAVGISKVARIKVDEINEMVDGELIKDVDELKAQLNQHPEISETAKAVMISSFGKDAKTPLTHKERYSITDELTKNHQAFKRGEISSEEFTALYNETMVKIASFGKRNGAGVLREIANKSDPSRFMNPDGTLVTGEALRERMAKQKDVKQAVGDIVKNRLDGLTSVQLIAKFGVSVPQDEEGRVKYEKAKTEQDEKNLRLRAAIDTEMDEYIDSYTDKNGSPPSVEEARQHLDKIQAITVFRTFRNSSDTPPKEKVVKPTKAVGGETSQRTATPRAIPVENDQVAPEEMDEYNKWLSDPYPMVLPARKR